MGVPSSTSNFDPMHGDLQVRINWGYLSTHLTAVIGKQLLSAYYGREPELSYHLGSSTRGRQSLVEAQRYPEDFVGVFAIAPAYNETGVTTYQFRGRRGRRFLMRLSFRLLSGMKKRS